MKHWWNDAGRRKPKYSEEKTRFTNGPEEDLCRPKHVAPLNLNKLNKLDVLDVKCLSFNIEEKNLSQCHFVNHKSLKESGRGLI